MKLCANCKSNGLPEINIEIDSRMKSDRKKWPDRQIHIQLISTNWNVIAGLLAHSFENLTGLFRLAGFARSDCNAKTTENGTKCEIEVGTQNAFKCTN